MTEPTLPGPEDQVTDEQILDILASVQDEHTPPLPGPQTGDTVSTRGERWTVASRHLVSPSTGEPYNVLRHADGAEVSVSDEELDEIFRSTRGQDALRRTFGPRTDHAQKVLALAAVRQHYLDTGEDIRSRATSPAWRSDVAGLVWEAASAKGRAELTAIIDDPRSRTYEPVEGVGRG